MHRSMMEEGASGNYIFNMRSVGLKVLNSKLSEYVRLAAGDETARPWFPTPTLNMRSGTASTRGGWGARMARQCGPRSQVALIELDR